jgi:tRNA(Ile)-lysidine synthase
LLVELLGDSRKAATIGGCVVLRRKHRLYVCREATKRLGSRSGQGDWIGVWDNRFEVQVSGDIGAWALRGLGQDGLTQLATRHGMSLKGHVIPVEARRTLPSLWRGNDLIGVPHLGFGFGLRAKYRPKQSVSGVGFPVADIDPGTI